MQVVSTISHVPQKASTPQPHDERIEFMSAWAALDLSHLCFYCGRRMKEFGPASRSIEHVLPKHLYPKLAMNTVGACQACNGAKNGFSLSEFRAWMGVFFCEKVLNRQIPEPSDVLLRSLYCLADKSFKSQMGHIETCIDSKRLSRKLRAIVKAARILR
jgi:hypothetical protein